MALVGSRCRPRAVVDGVLWNKLNTTNNQSYSSTRDLLDDKAHSKTEAAAMKEPPTLPELSEKPTVYSGCCLALSTPLLAHISALLQPSPSIVLSVGSGFGLLEAYLSAKPYSLNIIGVEVEPSPNKYLPVSNHRAVHGSRFLEPLASEAMAWLFIYPRRVGLLQEYLSQYGEGSVEKIIWAGPKADWEDYVDCFAGWDVTGQSADEIGGRASELIAVASKRRGGT
ncbi:Nn.00g079560.m01.CDS01 [Neocucurbitaria sp. VM-36]